MKKMGRFGLSLALILATFSLVSAPPVAQAAVGDVDTAMLFNGTSQSVQGTSFPGITGNFTLEVWVKQTASCSTGSGQIIYSQLPYQLLCRSNKWIEAMQNASSSWSENQYGTEILNQWVHLAYTRATSGAPLLYINGNLVVTGTTPTSTYSGTGAVIVGASGAANGYFPGYIDEIKVWNVVRTSTEIDSDMYSYNPATSGLIAYYDFNDVSGSVLNRVSGAAAGTNLTAFVGAPTTVDVATTDTSSVPGSTIVKFPRSYLNANGGWMPPANINKVEYLVVGGGGGAGWNSGGGGSGGGVDSGTSFTVTGSQTVVVGSGGAASTSVSINGGSGGGSTFENVNVSGGNGGIGYVNSSTRPLGGISVQGSGAGGYGTQNTGYVAQSGGAGPSSSITGAATNYAGGGGGGGWRSEVGGGGGAGGGGAGGGANPGNGTVSGTSGTTNTGGGGGANSTSGGTAGSGGSGIVIIKYKNYFGTSVTINVGAKKTTKSAGASAITATTTSTGTVTFYANGRIINGCKNVVVSGTTATCNWRPMTQGPVALSAAYTSNDSLYSGTVSSAAITTAVSKRTTAR